MASSRRALSERGATPAMARRLRLVLRKLWPLRKRKAGDGNDDDDNNNNKDDGPKLKCAAARASCVCTANDMLGNGRLYSLQTDDGQQRRRRHIPILIGHADDDVFSPCVIKPTQSPPKTPTVVRQRLAPRAKSVPIFHAAHDGLFAGQSHAGQSHAGQSHAGNRLSDQQQVGQFTTTVDGGDGNAAALGEADANATCRESVYSIDMSGHASPTTTGALQRRHAATADHCPTQRRSRLPRARLAISNAARHRPAPSNGSMLDDPSPIDAPTEAFLDMFPVPPSNHGSYQTHEGQVRWSWRARTSGRNGDSDFQHGCASCNSCGAGKSSIKGAAKRRPSPSGNAKNTRFTGYAALSRSASSSLLGLPLSPPPSPCWDEDTTNQMARNASTLALHAPDPDTEQDIASGRAVRDLIAWAESFKLPARVASGVAWLPPTTQLESVWPDGCIGPADSPTWTDDSIPHASAPDGSSVSTSEASLPATRATSSLEGASGDGHDAECQDKEAYQDAVCSRPTMPASSPFPRRTSSIYSQATHQDEEKVRTVRFDLEHSSVYPICEDPIEEAVRRISGQVDQVELMYRGLYLCGPLPPLPPEAEEAAERAPGAEHTSSGAVADGLRDLPAAWEEQDRAGEGECSELPRRVVDVAREKAMVYQEPPESESRRGGAGLFHEQSRPLRCRSAETLAKEYRKMLRARRGTGESVGGGVR